MQCWPVYQNLQLHHSSGQKMPPRSVGHRHRTPRPCHPSTSTNYIGCQYITVSPTNSVCWCTKYTLNEHQRTLLKELLPQQNCDSVPVFAPPAPANIRLQGHASNLVNEASPMQDPLRGILFQIMYNRWRTCAPHSRDILRLFFFESTSVSELFVVSLSFKFTSVFNYLYFSIV